MFNIKIKNNLKAELEAHSKQMLDDLADFILTNASQNLIKNNSIDTGYLLNSGRIENISNTKKIILWDAPYAEYVEYGTSPHWLPPEVIENDIARWAHRKLKVPSEKSVEVARKIAYKIAHEGIEPKPFVRPAIDSAVLFFGKKQL